MNSNRLYRRVAILLVAWLSLPLAPLLSAEDYIELSAGCTLYDAIIAANTDSESGRCPAGRGADLIRLTEDITLDRELPAITTSIAIEGNGNEISGDNSYRILEVDGATVDIHNLTLADGHSGTDGGAIYAHSSATLSVSASRFIRNGSNENGGAIAVTGLSSASIYGSSFIENENSRGDKAPTGIGGAIYAGGVMTLQVISSSLIDNAAHSGGAIGVFSSEVVEIRNSTISENRARYFGGGIYFNYANNYATPGISDDVLAEMTHLTIVDNVAGADGGGIHTIYVHELGGTIRLTNSLLAGNRRGDCVTPLNLDIGNLIADGSCSPVASGPPKLGPLQGSSAFYPLLDGSSAIDAAVAEHCLPHDQLGTKRPRGDACDIGAYEAASAVAQLPNSAPAVCTLREQIIAANTDAPAGSCPAGRGVDTIYLQGDVSVKTALPPITSAIVIEGNGFVLDGNDSVPLFLVKGGRLEINSLTMTRCYSPMSGGAIRIEDGAATVRDSRIHECTALHAGGALHISAAGFLHLSDSVIIQIQSYNRGAIYNGGVLRIVGSDLLGNGALENYSSGSAILNSDGTVVLIDSSISGYRAFLGSAIKSFGGTIILLDSQLIDNVADTDGGAIRSYNATIRITRSHIIGNTADARGGGISVHGGALILRDSLMEGNMSNWSGGAIAISDNPTVWISRSVLTDNRAGDTGGAIYANGYFMERDTSIKITESILSANSAKMGGAIHSHGITNPHRKRTNTSVDITKSVISRNYAQLSGGALQLSETELNVVDSILVDNTAQELASVIYAEVSAITLSNSPLDPADLYTAGSSVTVE